MISATIWIKVNFPNLWSTTVSCKNETLNPSNIEGESCVWLKLSNRMDRPKCMRCNRKNLMSTLWLEPKNPNHMYELWTLQFWTYTIQYLRAIFKPNQRIKKKKMRHDDVKMRVTFIVFIGVQGCPIFFRVDPSFCAHVGFTSKIHFPLSKSSASKIKIGPLENMNLVPWLDFVIDIPN